VGLRVLCRGDLARPTPVRTPRRAPTVQRAPCRPLGVPEGTRAGTWRREFAERGVTLHQADRLIAAAAVGIGAGLATANVDDFPMPELTVEHWPSDR
jgi:predicted nucleic acid-binding protein